VRKIKAKKRKKPKVLGLLKGVVPYESFDRHNL